MSPKTPIQELIKFCLHNAFNCTLEDGTQLIAIDLDEIRDTFDDLKQKEKAFAFDCYSMGTDLFSIDGTSEEVSRGFEQFYSQFANQE